MEHRAILRHVDAVAGEHHVPALLELGLPGEFEEQRQRLVGDAVLGIVEVEPGRLGGQPFTACWVFGKQIAQMPALDLGIVLGEGRVGGPFTQGCWGHESLLSASWLRGALVVCALSRPAPWSSQRSG